MRNRVYVALLCNLLLSSLDKTPYYLSDIKKKESFEFILRMKEKLNQISKMSEQQYAQADKGYDEVKTCIARIAKLKDENSVGDVIKQPNDKSGQVQNVTLYIYKKEAQKVLRTGNKIENSKIIRESNKIGLFYKNMKDAYQSVLSIFKYSHDIDEKQRESRKISENANGSYLNNMALDEFKGRLNNVKSKQIAITIEIDNAATLLQSLNKIKSDNKNYDRILEEAVSQ
ncbi:hypothetical protein C922_04597 [Plasmodium inui San Antonio 1]|uniref:Uncharacterized protein n=1 Tax=Plasmodium inui San Antonio 1 TaxID=1237626 RepID=W7A764_9APIC|nr:hypothetical protein C922_04597 [Plasmodium inui San Antonio 1]EUD64969.1 hypothetical protein C922_04597 [Plasmodium inui San Antonio 1]